MTNPEDRHQEPLEAIADAIVDERPIDWSETERAPAALKQSLANLRAIDSISRAQRQPVSEILAAPGGGNQSPDPTFRWGSL